MQKVNIFGRIPGILIEEKIVRFMANKENVLVVEGVVKENLPNTQFLVEIDFKGEKHEITGYLSGKMRMNYIRILEGDKVRLEMTPYDPKRGRIIYRIS